MDDILMAEFRGLFWGEGCLDINKSFSKKRNQFFYRPRMRIGMNIKERPLLKEIQGHFGGWLNLREKTNAIEWVLLGKKSLLLATLCLSGGVLSAFKRKEILIFQEAIDCIPIKGRKYTPAIKNKMERLYLTLKDMKNGS